MSKVDISIVIPNHNTAKLLEECLQSIKVHKQKKLTTEIIVVDNASTDGSKEMVREKFKDIILIVNKKNSGFARAVNQGWQKGSGELVVFLNSDTALQNNALEIMANYIQIHSSVGAISGKLTLRNGQIDPDTHRGFPTPWSSLTFFLGLEKLFPKSRLFAQYHQGWKNKDQIHEIDAGAGALLLVRRSILKKLGGWDEEYFFYGEDIDLCYRIKQAGWKVIFHPGTQVLHYKGASSGLRKESQDVAKPTKETLLAVTQGSIDAWKKFYKKFYKDKYPSWVTWLVITGIEIKGYIRLSVNRTKIPPK